MAQGGDTLAKIIVENEQALLADWLGSLTAVLGSGVRDARLEEQARQMLRGLRDAAQAGQLEHIKSAEWAPLRTLLEEFSLSRARQGATSRETAMFVFSLKQPLFARLRTALARQVEALPAATWTVSNLIDELGLYTMEAFLKGREEVIVRQQTEMLELSTPVVQLWDGILGLPVIGTLDSERTQVLTENLLQRIVETGATIAIIDITGVPAVDTLVAQHLLKTVAAARLMGADCIISGIRPQIAQTIVHLGVELNDVATKATLADAFQLALARCGATIEASAEATGAALRKMPSAGRPAAVS